MFNEEIAAVFEDIARILELQDANPFRIRAYRRAALNIRSLSEDIARLAERDELHKIPGIGEDLSAKILEYLRTRRIRFFEREKKKVPPFLVKMLDIPGVGPKTSRLIYDKLKPRNMEHLESLVRSGRIGSLPGIRDKSVQNLLDGIRLLQKHHDRSLLGAALPEARRIVGQLKNLKGIQDITYAGSVRRMCETVKDLDILIASKHPRPVMDAFTRMADVWKVLARGSTKASVVLREGLQVDLRVVDADCFGAALLYFTGSKAHNIKLRSLAKKRGLKISEYGLFREKTGRRLASRTEEDVYQALGLPWVPPEIREDQGEIEAALENRLPKLVSQRQIRGEFHMHSKWSDGTHDIEEMARSAQKRGLEYAVLTDHSQSLKIARGLKPADLLKQIKAVRAVNQKMKGFTLLAGSEVDILADGSLDFDDRLLQELDFVVASVHSRFKMGKADMTRRIRRAMQNPRVHLIAHPTGRLIGERNPYEVDFEELFREAKKTHTALEINSYPQRLDLNAVHARRAAQKGVLLAIDTDSHHRDQFSNLEYGVGTARKAWCEKKHVLNCLPLRELKKRIQKG